MRRLLIAHRRELEVAPGVRPAQRSARSQRDERLVGANPTGLGRESVAYGHRH
ncbi:MAG: hypothetical protein IPL59_13685 [Candidatus Competibacteraceae bacterium]|nr:hypothetical protein [Candidatus Competibacteraceae bacterium]